MTDDSSIQLQIDAIVDEFMILRRSGESPSIEHYTQKHPEIAKPLLQALETILLVEGLQGETSEIGHRKATHPDKTFPQIPDYRIVSSIGHGGMGDVYEAIQESLGRRVAIKVLPPGLSSDARYVERFNREARSAAKLHHTNIVPVFEVGGGETLFYAMQFIQGHSLDQIRKDATGLLQTGESLAGSSISSLLSSADGSAVSGSRASQFKAYAKSIARIGADISDALVYAHDRDIIHRDVKPSNLILDAQGVVWLTDFGLAKTVDSELTATGDVLGTIRYLAPEGFQGRADQASDIYSLGVTLYEMLTLRSPFDASNRAQLMQQITEGVPRKPRDIDDRIPVDLETIILKAIDKNPARRYPSAAALGQDLRRFLQNIPVHARRTSWLEQGLRWMNRNVALTAAMASMVLVIAVLVTASVAIFKQKQQSDFNFQRAEKQKELAEENFQLAYEAVDQFYNDTSNETLLDEPGMEGLRKKLLSDASKFYASLARRRSGGTQLKAEYVTAVYRQAMITYKIDSAEKAIRLLQELVSSTEIGPAASSQLLLSMIPVHQALGTFIAQQGDGLAGLSQQKLALQYSERLIEMDPDNWEYKLEKCLSIGKQVRYFGRRGKFEEAYRLANQTLQILDELDLEAINDSNLWMHAGLAIRLKGSIDTSTGSYDDAIKAFTEAIKHYRKALALKPGSALLKKYIGIAYGGIAKLQSRTGHSDQGIISNQKAIETFETLVADYPLNSLYKYDLSNRLTDFGIALWNKKDFKGALSSGLRAMRLREQLAERFPNKIEYQVRLARIYQNIGLYNSSLGNLPQRESYARKALEIAKWVFEMQPDSPRYLSDLCRMRSGLANALVAQGRVGEAKQLIEASWKLAIKTYRANPAVIELGIAVAESSVTLGEHQLKAGNIKQSAETFEQGLEVTLASLKRAPGNVSLKKQLWALYLGKGECALYQGDVVTAAQSKKESGQHASNEFKKTVSNLEYQQILCYQGKSTKEFNDILELIPKKLRQGNGRIQLELAFWLAARVHGINSNASKQPTEKATLDPEVKSNVSVTSGVSNIPEVTQCIRFLESAWKLGELDSRELPWLKNHPFFATVNLRPEFQNWLKKREKKEVGVGM